MEKNKRIMLIFILIAVSTLTILGGTFAYFKWRTTTAQQTAVTFTVTQGFSCSGDGGGNITSSNVKLAPAACTDSTYAIKRTVKFNTTINDGNPVYLNAFLKVNSISAGLSNSNNFKYALTTSDQGCDQGTVIASGTFNRAIAGNSIYILENKEYLATTTNDTYYLYIWLDEAETDLSTTHQSFDFSLGGKCSNGAIAKPLSAVNVISQNAVMDNINSTYVQNSTPGINFNAISSDTNGKGVYIKSGTENDLNPIYYYRGAIDNNNVLFGGFCWKIVRTTSTGGTKLIYNGLSSSGKCINAIGYYTRLNTASKFNTTSNSPVYIGYMYGTTSYTYSNYTATGSSSYYYGPLVRVSSATQQYSLIRSSSSYKPKKISTISGTNLNHYHYTCFYTTDTCGYTVYYIFYVAGTNKGYYITLSDGKKVEDALSEMFTNSSNETSSTIKTAIDTWYSSNMTDYTSKLEDTPYCNDRTIYSKGGWYPDGGRPTANGNDTVYPYLKFGPYQRAYSTPNEPYYPSLACDTNDAFTVNASNGNGKLTYPVGLLTVDEAMLAGGSGGTDNKTYYLYNNQNCWLMSPSIITESSGQVFTISSTGSLKRDNPVSSNYYIRPVITLAPATEFVSGGNGTANNPYVVYMED